MWGWNGWFLYWGAWKLNALKIIDLFENVAKPQQYSARENEIKGEPEAFEFIWNQRIRQYNFYGLLQATKPSQKQIYLFF